MNSDKLSQVGQNFGDLALVVGNAVLVEASAAFASSFVHHGEQAGHFCLSFFFGGCSADFFEGGADRRTHSFVGLTSFFSSFQTLFTRLVVGHRILPFKFKFKRKSQGEMRTAFFTILGCKCRRTRTFLQVVLKFSAKLRQNRAENPRVSLFPQVL